MKDNRDKKLTDLLIDLAIQYYMAFQAAPNTHRTLRQTHDNFMQNAKKKGDESGFPAASYSPLQLMELAVECKKLRKKMESDTLRKFISVVAVTCGCGSIYGLASQQSISLPWILFFCFAPAIAVCLIRGALMWGRILTYKVILTKHSEALYDFIDSLQALGTEFGPCSKFSFFDSKQFADYKSLQALADHQISECAKWVRVSSREGGSGGNGSLQKHEAERMFALAHAALARISLSTADFAPYYEKADKVIEEIEEIPADGIFGTKSAAVFMMEKPNIPLLG